jgi:PAS domain S-box-containing protein
MIGAGQDITERKRQEEAQARLAAIVTSSADAVVGKTLDGIVEHWNEAAERMFGYSAGEMIGQSIRRVIPADRQAEEDMILARLAQDQSIVHFETKRVTKDGRTFDASVTISPVHDAEGRVVAAAKIIRDITERKRVEEQVRLLMHEANHRAKNILSIVQAIARQTAAREPEDFVGRFTERLQALACWSGTSGMGSMWRIWRAHSSRTSRTLSGLGSLRTARNCVLTRRPPRPSVSQCTSLPPMQENTGRSRRVKVASMLAGAPTARPSP